MENNQKKSNNLWAMFAMFLLGVIMGFLFAPIKRGVRICCDNKDSMNAYNGGEDVDDFMDEDYEIDGISF
ncbi:MAG: hypothetical protein ACI4I6_05600 [Hominimerdicola sp.]